MKKNSLLLVSASLGFVLAVNIYFRSFPIYFPQLKAQARDTVRQVVQQHAVMEVQKKFPQFYYSARDAIVKSEMKAYYKANKKSLDTQVEGIYRNMKDRFQDDSGQTYLMELDCWHWARYVENVLKYGHPGDEVIAGRQWDRFMLTPKGDFLSWGHFLFYFSAFSYKAFSFLKTMPLFNFLFYLPMFFSFIFIIVLFAFSFRYGRCAGGIISCLFVGLAPVFLPRSCAGWFDMDVLNLLFPVLVVWSYLIFSEKELLKHKFQWIIVSSFFVGLFAFTSWAFWWYIVLVIVGAELLFFAAEIMRYYIYTRHKEGESSYGYQNIAWAALFLAFSLLWVFIISGGEPFIALFGDIKRAVALNKPLMASIWPNVFSTVGELRKMGLGEINNTIAPVWIVVLAMFSMLFIAVRAFSSNGLSRGKRVTIVIFVVWCLSMFFATIRGVRFSVFLLLPLGISLGWGIHNIFAYFRGIKNRIGLAMVFCVTIALCASLMNKGYAVAKSIYPLMDDSWYKVLNLVNEKTPQDAVINSWWDFGDWFKVVARRRIIFDGQSQHTPQAYWMAKAMLSSDENQAVTILRMLNNGGNMAFDTVNKHIKDPLEAVLLLEYFISLSPEQAKDIMPKFLPSQDASAVMNLLYSPSASAVFAVDHSMPYKLPAISYLGNWNFSRVYIAKNLNKIEKNKIVEYLKDMNGNEQDIQRWYQEAFLITMNNLDEWLSQRLQVYSSLLNGRIVGDVVSFENGFSYNVKDRTLGSGSGQVPRSMFNLVNGQVVETIYPNANVPFSILVYEAKDGYKSILLDRELGGSLFVRLYFMEGKGLKHFLPFVDSQEGNNYIRFFVIVW